jgi:hypothetical protein
MIYINFSGGILILGKYLSKTREVATVQPQATLLNISEKLVNLLRVRALAGPGLPHQDDGPASLPLESEALDDGHVVGSSRYDKSGRMSFLIMPPCLGLF